ncbi:MAG: WbqC family protein, partial [Patescibacteria group bacterium]|nr:WbqC family protein [Patescibacteria group bacterium]
MNKLFSLLLSTTLILSPIAENPSMALATLPASQNEAVKIQIEKALLESWTGERIRIAVNAQETNLLDINDVDCLLLCNGSYLVRADIAKDDKALLRTITAIDIAFILNNIPPDNLDGLKARIAPSINGPRLRDDGSFVKYLAGSLALYFMVKYEFAQLNELGSDERERINDISALIDSGEVDLDALGINSISGRIRTITEQVRLKKLAVYELIQLNKFGPLSSVSAINKKRVLLVASDVREIEHLEADKKAGVFVAPPYGLYRLKAYLESTGKAEVDVFDPNLYEEGMEEIYEGVVRSGNYDIIGFSPTHLDLQNDINLVWKAKDIISDMGSDTLIIAGGQEVTFNTRMWLENAPIDLVALGYGETVLESVIDRLSHGSRVDRDFLKNAKGVSFLDGEECVRKPAQAMSAEEYDHINSKEDVYENIPYDKYWDLNTRYYSEANLRARKATLRTVRIYTSTHCRNGCGFCSSCRFLDAAVNGDMPVLKSSPERVLAQLVNLCKKHDPDAVFFNDDDFIIDRSTGRERAIEICKGIMEAKSNGKLPKDIVFYAQMKARNLVAYDNEGGGYIPDLELIYSLKEAGFKLCALGVETFSDRLAYSDSINKKTTAAQSSVAIRGLLYAGVTPLINFILFPPETDKSDIVTTIDTCFEFIKMGAQASLGTVIEIYPGAAVADMDFPRSQKTITIPQNGKKVSIDMFILPVDTEIRAIARDIDEKVNNVIAEFKGSPLYSFECPPQILTVLAYFIATYEAMGLDDKARKIREFAEEVVIREEYYTVHRKPNDTLVSLIRGVHGTKLANAIGTYGYENNQFDIPLLIKCCTDMPASSLSGDRENSSRVKLAVIRKIERILALTQETGLAAMDDRVVRELEMFSRVLINDDEVDFIERERFLAFLNYRTRVKTRVDDGEYRINDNLSVRLQPEERVFIGGDEIKRLFEDRKVAVFEAHNDDAVVYLGDLLRKISAVADSTTVVTVFADPAGVTDAYAHEYAHQLGLPDAYYKSGEGSKALKKAIRKKEGIRVFTDVDNLGYKWLGAEPKIEEGVYNAAGRLFSYVTKYSDIGDKHVSRLKNIVMETDPDVIIMGYPGIAYQQNHRDLSRVLLKLIHEANARRKIEGKPKVTVLLYDESIDRYLFASYGIKANLYNVFGQDGEDVKKGLMDRYLSQTRRFPLYTYLMELRDRERYGNAAYNTDGTGGFAESLVVLKGLEFTDDKALEERRVFEDRMTEGIKSSLAEGGIATRLRVLDNNVFFESGNILVPGPVAAGKRIKSFLEAEGVISIMLDMPGGEVESRAHALLEAIDQDDLEVFLAFASTRDGFISFEVAGERPGRAYRYTNWLTSVRKKMQGKEHIKISGHQPGYHRYPGFFSKLAESDIFLFADDMKYTRDAWQARQKVGGDADHRWMTVPLVKRADEMLAEKHIANSFSEDWRRKHWEMIRSEYGTYPFFHLYEEDLNRLYSMRWETLNGLNEAITRMLAGMLGIKDTVMLSSSYLCNDPSEKKGERISSEIVKVLGDIISDGRVQVTYVSGKSVEYMDEELYPDRTNRDVIESKGIDVKEQEFDLSAMRETWVDVDMTITPLDLLSRYGPLAGRILSQIKTRKVAVSAPQMLLVNSWATGKDEGLSSAPPVGLYRLKKYIESNSSATVDVFDPGICKDPEYELYRLLSEKDYDVIGFQPMYVNLETDLNVMWNIRRLTKNLGLDTIIISGGQTATMSPEIMRSISPVDIIVTGFGEHSLLEIIRRIENRSGGEEELFKDINGTMLRCRAGEWDVVPSTHLSQAEFEELTCEYDPVGGIPYENYWAEMVEMLKAKGEEPKMMARVFTSSHCPSGCGFCSSQNFLPVSSSRKGVPILAVSAEMMYEMLNKAVKTQEAMGLFFNDDNVLIGNKAGRERMKSFCRLVVDGVNKGELPKGLIFAAQTRAADIVINNEEKGGYVPDNDLLDLMKEAGFIYLGIGIEA